jgi:hypothetical protein
MRDEDLSLDWDAIDKRNIARRNLNKIIRVFSNLNYKLYTAEELDDLSSRLLQAKTEWSKGLK